MTDALLPAIEIETGPRPDAAVIWMHGLGDSGHGKSSLAACFLAAGHRLLTDDLLVIGESGDYLMAHPGPPRIKLFPAVWRRK